MTNANRLFDPINDAGTRGAERWGRRDFVKGLSALAGSAGLLGFDMQPAAAEPRPETTRLRLIDDGTICIAPVFVAEALLKSEGFTAVRYLRAQGGAIPQRVAAGDVDIAMNFASTIVTRLDAGDPVLVLAGVHLGCFELFATDRVRAIRDLKGMTVAVLSQGSTAHYRQHDGLRRYGSATGRQMGRKQGRSTARGNSLSTEKAMRSLDFLLSPSRFALQKLVTLS